MPIERQARCREAQDVKRDTNALGYRAQTENTRNDNPEDSHGPEDGDQGQ